jgi:hypothetical protein
LGDVGVDDDDANDDDDTDGGTDMIEILTEEYW